MKYRFETPYAGANVVLNIRTLEGIMTAQPGDYIIRGVKGEIYPCKPDIFEATYEREDGPPSQTVRPDWKAIQWTGDKDMMNDFCDDLVEQGRLGYDAHNNVRIHHSHETVEIVALGDWIVRTEDGRFFSATGSALSRLAEMEGRPFDLDNLSLGFADADGKTKPFQSSEWKCCLFCGVPITEANDSGWERFTGTEGVTCPTCKECEGRVEWHCETCGWEGNERETVLLKITEETAEPGYCPLCYQKCEKIPSA